jgi:hypothetical protein
MSRSALACVLAALALTGPAFAEREPSQPQKHSGVIVAIAADAGTITVEEFGPSAGPNATAVRQTIRLRAETRIELVVRAQAPATTSGWQGDFTAVPLASRELHPGDFVTVTTESTKGLVASSITVVRPVPPRQSSAAVASPVGRLDPAR